MRRQAKAVNFGIVYGKDYGLSRKILGITRKKQSFLLMIIWLVFQVLNNI